MRIKSTLTPAFMIWMQERGHKIGGDESSNTVVMKKDGKKAIIFLKSEEEYYSANTYAIQRYKAFLWAWLSKDRTMIEKLNSRANLQVRNNRKIARLSNIK